MPERRHPDPRSSSKVLNPPTTKKLLELPAGLAVDLEAFCQAHYGAAAAEVMRQALRRFIDTELDAEPHLRERFLDAKKRLSNLRPGPIRLIKAREQG